MAAGENYATCWVHKDFICTDNNTDTLRKAAGASGGKDERQVRVIGIEQEY